MSNFQHKLGAKAKCKITGFTGVLTSRCEFLTGCNRYCIQPTELKDGKPIDGIYFDEAQIKIVGEAINPKDVQGEKKGACSADPTK
jgi:hypothetical protein